MFVRRDDQGNIAVAYTLPQKDKSLEVLADDDPELLAFLNPLAPSLGEQVSNALSRDPVLSALVRKLSKDAGKTEQQMIAEIAAEAKA